MASARYYDMRQWWRGRALPMAGVAGVKVAPHEQGRGLGRALMTALLEQMAAARLPAVGAVPGHRAAVPVPGLGAGRRPLRGRDPGPLAAALLPPDPLAERGPGGAARGPAARRGPAIRRAPAGRPGGARPR